MATIDLGKVAFVWKGTYNSGTTYEEKDVVQYTDSGELSSYIYVNASSASGQTPSTGGTVNTTYWSKMAGGTSLSVGNNKIVTTDSSGSVSSVALGSAGQALKVNSGATGFEFGSAGGLVQTVVSSNGFHTSNSNSWTSTGYEVTITPTSASNKIHVQCSFVCAGTPSNATLFKIMRSINGGSYADVDLPSARGNRMPAHAGDEHNPSNGASHITIRIYDSTHNTTNAITYRLYKRQESTANTTVIGNPHNGDADAGSGNAQTATINTNMVAEERT